MRNNDLRIGWGSPVNRRPQNLYVKKILKYFRSVVDEIDKGLKRGNDNAVIITLVKTFSDFRETKEGLASHKITVERLSDIADLIAVKSTKGKTPEIEDLRNCLSSFEPILQSLYRKKAFVLLRTFNKDELKDSAKAKEISFALNILFIRDRNKDEIIEIAIKLAEEIELRKSGYIVVNYLSDGTFVEKEMSEEERAKISSFMADEYIWYMKRLGFDDGQIELVSGKFNGITFDDFAKNIKGRLTPVPIHVHLSGKKIHVKNTTGNGNGIVKPAQPEITKSPGNSNGSTVKPTQPVKKASPKEITPLDDTSRDKLICETYRDLVQYPTSSYEDFLEKLSKELNKQRAFKELGFDSDKLKIHIEKKIGLTENHFKVLRTYRELLKTFERISFEALLTALGKDFNTEIVALKTLGIIELSSSVQDSPVQLAEQNTDSIVAPKSLVDSLIDGDTGKVNPKGHVLSIKSNINEVKIIDGPDGRTMEVHNSVSNANLHQVKLNHALELLNNGSLVIYGSQAKGNLPIKIETVVDDGNSIALVCLHSDTRNRIWGKYNIKTGELVFLGMIKSHSVWKSTIEDSK